MFALLNAPARRHASRRQPSPVSHPAMLSVEALEGRTLLAGNVITTPTGTPNAPGEPAPDLVIEGDIADNEIMIRKGNSPQEIIVNGLNSTLVNGSNQEWHYQGVERITVLMDGGADVLDVRNLEISSESLTSLAVDGGNGDDRITVFNTAINANAPADAFGNSASVDLFGDFATPDTGTTTGNDIIDVSNTTIFAEDSQMSAAVLRIFGDANQGGNLTGGNDRISVTNTDIIATNATLGAGAALLIYGDFNLADTAFGIPTSTIGQGNDSISVTGTTITAAGAGSEGESTTIVQIIGEQNQAFGAGAVATIGGGNDSITVDNTEISAVSSVFANPNLDTPILQLLGEFNRPQGGGVATVGPANTNAGGNDSISLTNTTVSASGSDFENTATVQIQGDNNYDSLPNTARINGGDDDILVQNFIVNASGGNFQNTAELDIFGDGDYQTENNTPDPEDPTKNLVNQGQITSGSDTITVLNTDISATGGSFDDAATFQVFGDDGITGSAFPTTVGTGRDDVKVNSLFLRGDIGGLFNGAETVRIDTRSGDDSVDVRNSEFGLSRFDLGDGNDTMTFNGNSFASALLDGGTGIDTLNAHGNVGVLVPTNFEFVNLT